MATIAGVDIGFSSRKRTNAIAVLRGEDLSVRRLSVAERNGVLGTLEADVVAFDAPLLPGFAPRNVVRRCEAAFSRGLFQTRCKPGMSHVRGTGEMLREHGKLAASLVTSWKCTRAFPHVIPGKGIVEAFPNAFLGILLDDSIFELRPRLGRGEKFDWLYERCIESGVLARLVDGMGLPASVAECCANERDHEHRAALICLLTAAAVHAGHFTAVGHSDCGYFFVPAMSEWSAWAQSSIAQSRRRQPDLVVAA